MSALAPKRPPPKKPLSLLRSPRGLRSRGFGAWSLLLLVAVACFLQPGLANAWVETSIQSHLVTVDVDRQGKAKISHELMIGVRGGPLDSYTVRGIDPEATLVSEATAVVARADTTTSTPLSVERLPDGSVRLSAPPDSGLSRGTYVLNFSYRHDLLEGGNLKGRGSYAELNWKGPVFPEGIDSAKAIFRFPRAEPAPALPPQDLERASLGLGPEPDGVFVSNLARTHGTDELELLRLHLSRNEPAEYQVRVSLQAFDALAAKPQIKPKLVGLGRESLRDAVNHLGWLSLLWALVATLAAAAKLRESRLLAAELQVSIQSLLPLPWLFRAVLFGASLAGAVWLVTFAASPLLALVTVFSAFLLFAHSMGQRAPLLRGPGEWRLVQPKALEGWLRKRDPKRRDYALQLSSWRGSVAFFGLLLLGVLPLCWLKADTNSVLLLGSLWVCAVLVLFSSGVSKTRSHLRAGTHRTLASCAKNLVKSPRVRVELLGRFPLEQPEPDELRVRFFPDRAKPGLIGVELCLMPGPHDVLLPCLILRVLHGSLAQKALPRELGWMRGRTPEERVAVCSPRLPLPHLARRLILELLEFLREPSKTVPSAQAGSKSQKSSRSAGNALRTSNGKSFSSPAKAA